MSFRRRSLTPSAYLPYSSHSSSSHHYSPYSSSQYLSPSSSSLYLSPSTSYGLSRSRQRSNSYSNLYVPRSLSSSASYQDPVTSSSSRDLSYRSRSTASSRNSVKSETDSGLPATSSSTSLSNSSASSSKVDLADNSKSDFKKLYEESLVQIEALKKEFAQKEQEWLREKRQQQRKISELEEEVKSVEILKSDNQRLKDENGALIRVISKLSK